MKKIYILFLGICMVAAPLWAMKAPDVERLDDPRYKKQSDALKRIRAVTMLGAISTRNQKLANDLYLMGINTALLISDDMRFASGRDQVERSNQEITDFLYSLDPSIKDFVQSFIQSHQDVLGNNKLWERLRVKKDLMLLSDPRLNDVKVEVKKTVWAHDADISHAERQIIHEDERLVSLSINKSVAALRTTLGRYLEDFSRGYQEAIRYRRYNIGVPYVLGEVLVSTDPPPKIDDETRARVNQELRAYLRVLGPLLIRDFEGTMNKLGAILQTPVDQLATAFPIENNQLEIFQLPVPVVREVVREEISPSAVREKAGFNLQKSKIMGLMGAAGAVMLIARKKLKQYTPSLKGITSVPKRYPYISALVVAGLVATAGVGAGKYKRLREQE